MAKSVVDLSDFFTRSNEEEGVWYEGTVAGEKVGFEALVLGTNSNAATIATNIWQKEIEEQKLIEDEVKRGHAYERSCAKRVAAIVAKFRGKDGKDVAFNGKTDISKEDIEEIMFNAPALAADYLSFSMRNANFLEKKKNK